MKLGKLTQELELISVHADLDTEIGGICYDSRLCAEGDLFVAIKV